MDPLKASIVEAWVRGVKDLFFARRG